MSSLSKELRDGLKTDPVTMTFGPEGFFGYAPCTKTALEPSAQGDEENIFMWWSTYEAESAPCRNMPLTDVHAQLIKRHGFWKLPYDTPTIAVYSSIINLACGINADEDTTHVPTAAERNVLVLPRYITPRLPHWCTPSGKIILLGDAAHAMPPDSGQGVSCAVEDGLALGILLKHHLTQTSPGEPNMADALKRTKIGYEAVRMPRVGMILDMAKRIGERKKKQTWFQEKVRDWIMWVLCEFFYNPCSLPRSIANTHCSHRPICDCDC
jgi:2-polyprenyl-6-methoxyphenol hydroxylase-like FAD-dependent oxidoreductase